MKTTVLTVLALTLGAFAGASAQAMPAAPQAGVVIADASTDFVQKAQWGDDWHNRWRSHRRWGSPGPGPGPWHNRWRSHRRWGSDGPGPWHNRWRSHYRWGSGYRY